MEQIKTALMEFGPCSIGELWDYMRSDFYLSRGRKLVELNKSQIRYAVEKLVRNEPGIFRLYTLNGTRVRYGFRQFKELSKVEPRYLQVKGDLWRCMKCGMPIYQYGNHMYHFEYPCEECQAQSRFKRIKVNGEFYAIVDGNYVYGVLDNLHLGNLRLPEVYRGDQEDVLSELWAINIHARDAEVVEWDKILCLNAQEILC